MKVEDIEGISREAVKGSITAREAGRLGGLETLRRYGRHHFVTAGHLGQQVIARLYAAEDRRRWGSMGGRPRKRRLVSLGERGNTMNEGGWEPARSSAPFPRHTL